MTFFQQIIRSGLTSKDDYQNRRGIILTNYISVVLCAALLLLYFNRLTFYGDNMLDTLLVGLPALAIPILCNRFFLTTLSRLLLCYIPVCFIWFAFIIRMWEMKTIDQSAYDGLRIFLLSVCFIPYLLFDRKKWPVLLIGILPMLLSFLLFDYLLRSADVLQGPIGVATNDYQLTPARVFVAYIVISLSCFIFQSIISQNDAFNKRLLAELKNKNEEIEAQNEMLLHSQLKLHDINQHLEKMVDEKTRNIQQQNEVLLNYSFTNAHKVRGAVARILGLIQLSRIKTDLDYPWFFAKVENETREIDEIVKQLSKDLDEAHIERKENATDQ